MPKALRHQRRARIMARTTQPTIERQWYRITDPHHRPDLRRQFGGVAVHNHHSGSHVVQMSAAQARWHLDQGSLVLLDPDEQQRLTGRPPTAAGPGNNGTNPQGRPANGGRLSVQRR